MHIAIVSYTVSTSFACTTSTHRRSTLAIDVTLALLASIHLPRAAPTTMANYARYGLVIIMLGIVCGQELDALEDVDRNILSLNVPYDSGLDSELQLKTANYDRLLLMTSRLCHLKRNSELINSLLGLPKNVHNAGK